VFLLFSPATPTAATILNGRDQRAELRQELYAFGEGATTSDPLVDHDKMNTLIASLSDEIRLKLDNKWAKKHAITQHNKQR
jgi:hypothetical protein